MPEICPEGKTFEGEKRRCRSRQPARPGHRDRARVREVVRVHDLPRDRPRGLRLAAAVVEDEDDLLDRAWGLTPLSRLSCQAIVARREARDRDSEVHDQLREGERDDHEVDRYAARSRSRSPKRIRTSIRARPLHRPAALGAASCRASTTTRSTAARRSSRRSRWRGSTRATSTTTDEALTSLVTERPVRQALQPGSRTSQRNSSARRRARSESIACVACARTIGFAR